MNPSTNETHLSTAVAVLAVLVVLLLWRRVRLNLELVRPIHLSGHLILGVDSAGRVITPQTLKLVGNVRCNMLVHLLLLGDLVLVEVANGVDTTHVEGSLVSVKVFFVGIVGDGGSAPRVANIAGG